MSVARKLGILVFFGVPAIVGGGVVYALAGNNYTAVFIYETLLVLTAGAWIARLS
ncbi:MAG: hypothetical protein RBR20_07580 [Desulfobacterales bacterium]|jgi:hypothetical protein|nr:hypothetical protein [Desulfobacteraceae bacterium]MDD3991749.1 hypothetical protein [Desulfobacteraceae bacterium]MDY0311972.1 hypothetical protein [Desulfobacterales bacterium]